jgi:hypothetical protein
MFSSSIPCLTLETVGSRRQSHLAAEHLLLGRVGELDKASFGTHVSTSTPSSIPRPGTGIICEVLSKMAFSCHSLYVYR